MYRMRAFLFVGALIAASGLSAQRGSSPPAGMSTSVTWMQSRALADSFAIHVALPTRYGLDSTRRYGTLYVLDADKSFGLARDVVDWLAWSGASEIPPLIVVGIAYGRSEREWWTLRSRDMTPSKDRSRVWGEWPRAGGAAAFQEFLRTELIPEIERRYRTLPDTRIIAGLSFGGLFAGWSILAEPIVFSHAVAVSPAFVWDSLAFVGQVRTRSAVQRPLAVHFYTAIGSGDDSATVRKPWQKTVAAMEALTPLGFDLHQEVLAGESHISAWPVGLTRGLKVLLGPQKRP